MSWHQKHFDLDKEGKETDPHVREQVIIKKKFVAVT